MGIIFAERSGKSTSKKPKNPKAQRPAGTPKAKPKPGISNRGY